MRHLKSAYIKAMEWKSNTGAGVLETEGEQYVASLLEKKCPYFTYLDNIFGNRKNVNVPVIFCSTDSVDSMLRTFDVANSFDEIIESVDSDFYIEDTRNENSLPPLEQTHRENVLQSVGNACNESSIQMSLGSSLVPETESILCEQSFGVGSNTEIGHTETSASGISFGQPRAVKKRKVSVQAPIIGLLEIQSERLELEKEKFDWQKSKDKHEMDRQKAKDKHEMDRQKTKDDHERESATLQLQQQLQINKLQLEMQERLQKNAL